VDGGDQAGGGIVRPGYFLRRALEALFRGPFVTLVSIGTVFAATLVTGLFASTLLGAERIVARWGGEVRISAYLHDGADVAAVAVQAHQISGGEVRTITPEQAFEQLSASLGELAPMLEGVGRRALPASVEVAISGVSTVQVRALAAQLARIPGVEQVDFGGAWLDRLESFLRRFRWIGGALLIFLVAATALLVGNTLRLAVYARREEIEIMKLVGATNRFVGAPFLIEGTIQGILGAALATAVLVGLHAALGGLTAEGQRWLATLALTRDELLPARLLLSLVAGGAFVGLLGSALSVGRHLRDLAVSA
jgi:cell division transport system permease protein